MIIVDGHIARYCRQLHSNISELMVPASRRVFDVAIHAAPRLAHVRMSSRKVPFSGNGKELRRH